MYIIYDNSMYIKIPISSLTLRVWEVCVTDKTRKVIPTDCNLGQLKRVINSIEVL